MKTFFMTILVLLGIGTILSFVLGGYPIFTTTGKAFLVQLSEAKYYEAYDQFTDEFKAQHSPEQFTQMIIQSGLTEYKSVDWVKTVGDKQSGYATIVGIVTTKDGKKIPLLMRFIKLKSKDWYEQKWRISELKTEIPPGEGLH